METVTHRIERMKFSCVFVSLSAVQTKPARLFHNGIDSQCDWTRGCFVFSLVCRKDRLGKINRLNILM